MWQFCDPGTDPLCVPLQIMPSSGLIDGQSVQVLSTGSVLPSSTYQLEECQGVFGQQIYEAAGCDPTTLVTATTPATTNADGSGTLSTPFTVQLNITVNGAAVNCFFTPCVIAVLGVPQYNPINFAPPPPPPPPPPPYPSSGAFIIGDGNAVVGNQVYFWGSQWAKHNSLSGGSAPNELKGFESSIQPQSCSLAGVTWTAQPGDSADPPATVPSLMIVVVTSKATKSGSTMSGDVTHLALVKVDPGYQPDPGHPGTGQVLQTC